jgi:signal transduction histidine kinase
MRISIATKVFIAFSAMLVTFGAVQVVNIYQMRTVYDEVELINFGYVPLNLVLNDVRGDLRSYDMVLAEKDWEALRRTLTASRRLFDFPDQIDVKLGQAANQIASILELPLERRDRDFLRALAEDIRQTRTLNAAFAKRSDRFNDVVIAGNPEEAEAIQVELRRMERRLESRIRQSRQAVRDEIDRALRRAQASERRSLTAAVLLSLNALIVSGTLMLVIHLTIRPIRRLTEGAKRIASGDYVTIEPVNSHDEIGILSYEFNHMVRILAERDVALRDKAKSDRLAAIGEIAAKVTHELRNPLSTIQLNAEMLEEELMEHGIPADSETVETLRAIISEVERLTAFTEEYLRFARLPDPLPVPSSVNGFVEQVMEFRRDDLERTGVSVELALGDDLPEVNIDTNQLRRALVNLVLNSCQAMEESEIRTLTVTTRLDSAAENVVIEVWDTGAGIAEHELSHVFEPFFSTKSAGTGLGLPLTLQIVQEHGGTLRCSSQVGEGTRFEITLPVQRGASRTAEHQEEVR